MLVKFRSPAVADEEIANAPYKTWLDPTELEETRIKVAKFWEEYFDYSKKMASAMMELEKAAFNERFILFGKTFHIFEAQNRFLCKALA
jgi:predicted metal-binding protein